MRAPCLSVALASVVVIGRAFSGGLGNAHGLTIEYDATGKPARFLGAADPPGNGRALGY